MLVERCVFVVEINHNIMTVAFIISFIIAGMFFFLWQDEHEKRIAAEKEIKILKKRHKRGENKKETAHDKRRSTQAVNDKTKDTQGFIIARPQPKVIEPLLDQRKLAELRKQTKESQDILAEIFVHDDVFPECAVTTSDNEQMLTILTRLFEKEIWNRIEIMELAGPDVMIGSLLEQINDYSCSKINDIVVEEDGDLIYVTTEYKTQLI